ncbi:DUF4175 family protein [Nonlabens marinus]|uniref:Liver stage antigen, putative n=1 Tax=Nonlabens marinus S1-08 TaxID=1454201 RepID=W8VQ43_9FLAO|nr:DUF4175 family protein [Nonlabens marinus]BAO54840.1 liver stage antigen, putative [Nonlabens marinus S1-08]
MTNFQIIQSKLNKFIRKYYVNELIRGVILFLAMGLLYFILVAAIEYFFWLNKVGRTILFWSFIAVEAALLIKFIAIPIARLVKLFSGIDFRDASEMIGTHFPEVSDKLVNVLQLQANGGDDELTWASINQKSEELKPIPFSLAIDFNKNRHYLKYLALPVVIIAALLFTGNNDVITSSASRVADYQNEYLPPAPFNFEVTNAHLNALQNQSFELQVKVTGTKLPENASIHYNGQQYFLTQLNPGNYTFKFDRPTENTSFYLAANDVRSIDYTLQIDAVPVMRSFELALDYPAYTGKKDEVLKSTGNALVPQGTKITWNVDAAQTDLVQFRTEQQNYNFNELDGKFAFAKAFTQKTPYTITTSNQNVRDYEKLDFTIDVIVDEYPELSLEMKRDSLDERTMYFKGQAADDYGLKRLQMVYYKDADPLKVTSVAIPISGGTFEQFLQQFPGNLQLEAGNTYSLYFEATDNDVIHNFKSVKSEVFTYNKPTADKEQELKLQQQKESLSNLEKALKEQKEQQSEIKELSRDQMEKDSRSFNDKKKLDQALKNQQKQEQQIRKEINKLENQLDKSNQQQDEQQKKLQERLKETAEQSKKNEELLKKLEEYQDKISKEELQEQLEKTQKNTKQQQRSLEQLLELTKRYYVSQKFEQLSKKLTELAEKQEQQSKKEGAANQEQDQKTLNEEYKKWEQELRELEKENNALKDAMDLEFDPQESDEIKSEQQKASENLKKQAAKAAQVQQKNAAQKMKQQAASMQQDMAAMEGEAMEEDLEMLRQILDNLVLFSERQEEVLGTVKSMNRNSPNLSKSLKVQKDLESAFKHVDDSLFALSSRNVEIGKDVNEQVLEVYYNMEKSLEQIAELDLNRGQISQQFALNGANQLAVILSDLLDAANNPSASGKPNKSGQGAGFQLPNIIKQQESLKEGKGKDGKGDDGEGKDGQKGNKPGQSGQQGSQGENGKSGENGREGQGDKPASKGSSSSGDGNNNSKSENGNGTGEGKDGEKQSYRESEEESKRIYVIYKEQQQLRDKLENMIIKEGLQQKVDKITDEMKGVERKLLDEGFNREVRNQMTEIIHDLMQLKDANLEQGEAEQRQSISNEKLFVNPLGYDPKVLERYFNNKEILNRQVLPLQPQYRSKVKEYFKTND